jgi:hemerythrin
MALEQFERKEKYLRDASLQRTEDHRKMIKELCRDFEEAEKSVTQRRITRSMARSQDQDDSLVMKLSDRIVILDA